MKNALFFIIFAVCWSCGSSSTEKHQNSRNKIVNIKNKIKEIEMEDILIGQLCRIYTTSDYLIICDYKAFGEQIHLFDKNNFTHVTSTANKGQGPGEIANMGHIETNDTERLFYVSDHGKQKIFAYKIDSLLAGSSYLPEEKMTMKEILFPSSYNYLNDTLSVGIIIEPIGNYGFNQSVAKFNMNTGNIEMMKYKHPEIERKRICFAVSAAHDIYVEGYSYHDLMTICSLDGDLKHNIYGTKWDNKTSNEFCYYRKVVFCKNKILASYSEGKHNFSNSEEKHPTKFLIFNTEGDYIQTLETEYKIVDFCYDKDNNRIIMFLDEEIQLAYLDLDGILQK